MALFGSPRRQFLDRFESRSRGLAHRWILDGRAAQVTAEEHGWLIQDHNDGRAIFWIMLPAGWYAAQVIDEFEANLLRESWAVQTRQPDPETAHPLV